MKRAPKVLRSVHHQSNQDLLVIEVGSSRTRVLRGQTIIYDQPSCIALNSQSEAVDDRSQILAIGDKAYQLLGKKRQSLRVEFPVNNGAVASPAIFVQYMTRLKKQLNVQFNWWQQLTGKQCLVALSDTLSPSEREITQNQFAQLKLGQLSFLSAELAAAANLNRSDDNSAESYCLINMGGMVTTTAIIQRGEVVSSARIFVGGMQLTTSIQQLIRTEYSLAVSWREAEKIKQTIGRVGRKNGSKETRQQKMSVQGKDLTSQLGRTAVIDSDQLQAALAPHMDNLVIGLQHFFVKVPTELVTNSLQNGVLLTGGASQLAGANKELEQQLHAQVIASDTPFLDVINGLQKISHS